MATTDSRLTLLNEWLCGRPENTIKSYRQHMLALLDTVPVPYAEMTLGILQAHVSGLTERSQHQRATVIRSFLGWLFNRGLITNTDFRLLKYRHLPIEHDRYVSPEDMRTLITCTKLTDAERLLLRIIYHSGCRNSEISNLRWLDVLTMSNGSSLRLLGKGAKIRNIMLSKADTDSLLAFRETATDAESVFNHSPHQIRLLVKKAAAACGLSEHLCVHSLRHAFASHLLQSGKTDIITISRQLGHSSIATTQTYLHTADKELGSILE